MFAHILRYSWIITIYVHKNPNLDYVSQFDKKMSCLILSFLNIEWFNNLMQVHLHERWKRIHKPWFQNLKDWHYKTKIFNHLSSPRTTMENLVQLEHKQTLITKITNFLKWVLISTKMNTPIGTTISKDGITPQFSFLGTRVK